MAHDCPTCGALCYCDGKDRYNAAAPPFADCQHEWQQECDGRQEPEPKPKGRKVAA